MAKKKSKLSIRLFPDSALFTKCAPVTKFDSELHQNLDEMAALMKSKNGMGLAANQVGLFGRFFVMQDLDEKVWEFINPTILEAEGDPQGEQEGCLSIPGVFIRSDRPWQVTVKAQDRTGQEFTVVAYGYESLCLQHEINHLNGIFFLTGTQEKGR